jgi:hypothetical protein
MIQNEHQTKPAATKTLPVTPVQKALYQEPKLEQHGDYKLIVAGGSGF